jgi:hypothetical protein
VSLTNLYKRYEVLGLFGDFRCLVCSYSKVAVGFQEAVGYGGCGNIFRGTVRLADLPSNDRDILVSEQYYHVPRISESVYNNIYAHFVQQCDVSHFQAFPDGEILDTFLQLYFEFFHQELPLFHLSSFDPSPESWMLVVAIVAVGCNYSMSQYRQEVSETMFLLLHRLVSQKVGLSIFVICGAFTVLLCKEKSNTY